jgi:hypothetical protein
MEDVDSNLATVIRTSVILVFDQGFGFGLKKHHGMSRQDLQIRTDRSNQKGSTLSVGIESGFLGMIWENNRFQGRLKGLWSDRAELTL